MYVSLLQICGLQLEGCSFDGGRLSETQHNSPSVVTLPPCTITWVPPNTPPPYPPQECLSLPVYYSSHRQKLVTKLTVPCGASITTTIQSGAGIFLKNQ